MRTHVAAAIAVFIFFPFFSLLQAFTNDLRSGVKSDFPGIAQGISPWPM
jgi:hypothetical protein